MTARARRLALLGVASLLGAFAILLPELWFLAPVSLACLLFISLSGGSVRSAALYGLFYGFVTAGAGIWWFFDTLPFDWLGIEDPATQGYAVTATWAYISAFMALPVAAFAGVAHALRTNRFLVVLVPVLWIAAEEGRMWGFAVATVGDLSLMGPHFSAAALGYALAEHPHLLALAYPFGITALSGAVAAFALLLTLGARHYLHAQKDGRFRYAALVVGLILLTPYATHTARNEDPLAEADPVRVAIVGTDWTAGDQDKARTRRALEKAAAARADVVLLPEGHGLTGVFGVSLTKAETEARVRKLFAPNDALIFEAGPLRSSLSAFSTERGELAVYEKIFLMPMGEYPPAFAEAFFSVAGDDRLDAYVETLGTGRDRGETVVPVPYRGIIYGPLLCSDIISPRLFRDLAQKKDASVLVALSNLSWFNGSRTLHDKIVQIAKVHAVGNRSWLLNAVNGSPSFVVSPRGILIGETPWHEDATIYLNLPEGVITPSAEAEAKE